MKQFKYYTAAETQKEGYLRRRFSEIRKRQAEESAAKKAPNVRKLQPKEKANAG